MPKIQAKKTESQQSLAGNGKIEKAEVRRGERLAVNLFDLMRMDDVIRECFLGTGEHLKVSKVPIKVDPDRLDETAVEFTCGLLTAACCCDAIRHHDEGHEPYPTRVYLMLRGGTVWNRLSGSALLTLVEGDKVVLNPKVFKVEVEARKPVPPWARKKV